MIRNTIGLIRYNKTYCTLIATMILASYSVTIVQEINDTEPYPDYYENIIPMKMDCSYEMESRGFLKYWMNCFSYEYVGHDRIIPIIASISIVYFTYVLANTITNNRIIGLISMGAVSVNPLLTMFDSSPTYDQVWAALFLFSVFLLYKKPVIGIVSFPLSIISKVLAVAYLPGMILNILIDNRIKHRKKILLSTIPIAITSVFVLFYFGVGNTIGLYPERLLDGFLRIFESIWTIFPVVIGAIVVDRFFMSKEKPQGKKVVLVWIACILLTTPMIYLFTESQYQFGYRFVPFAVFFSIYLGMVCVQLGNFITETRLRKQSLKSIL